MGWPMSQDAQDGRGVFAADGEFRRLPKVGLETTGYRPWLRPLLSVPGMSSPREPSTASRFPEPGSTDEVQRLARAYPFHLHFKEVGADMPTSTKPYTSDKTCSVRHDPFCIL